MFEKLQTLVDAEIAAAIAKLFPKISAADKADIDAITPHIENIVWRDLGTTLLTKLAAKYPSAATALNALSTTLAA